jgi:hypothetical protein
MLFPFYVFFLALAFKFCEMYLGCWFFFQISPTLQIPFIWGWTKKLRLKDKMALRKTLLCEIKHNLLRYSQYKTQDTKHPLMSSIQHTLELFLGCFTWFYVKSCSMAFHVLHVLQKKTLLNRLYLFYCGKPNLNAAPLYWEKKH